MNDVEYERMEALYGYQATTPVWYVLNDPVWVTGDDFDDQLFMCMTSWEYRVLRIPVNGACDEQAHIDVVVTCRSCGERTFTICGDELDDLVAGVEHTKPWCVYCTKAVARHEVLAIRTVQGGLIV